MEFIEKIIGSINDALYGYVLIILLLAGGLYFTVRTKFSQFRLMGEQFKAVTEKPQGKNKVSSFQALMVSILEVCQTSLKIYLVEWDSQLVEEEEEIQMHQEKEAMYYIV